MPRVDWNDLPERLRADVEARTGPIRPATSSRGGQISDLAAVLDTARGRVFVKGLRLDNPRVFTQQREAMMNPYLDGIAPRLLWRTQTAGWDVLAFEDVTGRHADLSPGSADLPKVAHTLDRLSRLRCPDEVEVRTIEHRWAEYADQRALKLLAGDTLLHTDLNPTNFLINHTAYLVDWSWPSRGAAWIDTACLLLWLVAEGHHPADADTWAQQLPAWTRADPAGIAVFADVNRLMWHEIATDNPQPWKVSHAIAAQNWWQHVTAGAGS